MSTRHVRFPLTRSTQDDRDPELTLTMRCTGPLTKIDATGAIDLSTADLLTATIDHVISAHAPTRLVLELSGVRLLSAAGISALLHARDAVTAQAGQLTLHGPSPMVRKVLDITDTARVFDIVDSPGRLDTTPDAAQHHH
jgi:anti-sigma B factor antagonist